MNPSSNEASGLSLPPPVSEQLPAAGIVQESGPRPMEQAPAGQERGPSAGQAAPAAMPAIPLPVPPAMPAATASDVTATSQSGVLQASDDKDLIEKEWVNKAKQIVERTRDDPYQQSEQLTVVKADYIKKRYDKTIKLSK